MRRFLWLLTMAWRDGRRNSSKLFLFSLSIITGVAALVAIRSFSNNLQTEIRNQAREILGADLVITTSQAPTQEVLNFLDSLGGIKSKEVNFSSMVLFPQTDQTRLCQIRGVERSYPFYGTVETINQGSLKSLFYNGSPLAMPEELILMQFKLKQGDSIKIGSINFKIEGSVNKIPGQSGFTSGVAPVIFIPYSLVLQTQLIQQGSRVNYKYYFKFSKQENVDALISNIKPRLDQEHLRYDTVKTTQTRTSEAYQNLSQYLNLIGFIALLLGCIGVSSSVQIYIKEKIPSVAILRCLGVSSQDSFMIYLIQVFFLGCIGAFLGTFAGAMLQLLLPRIFQEFLTVEVEAILSVPALLEGISVGIIIALLFGLMPLLEIKNISPLNALRISFNMENRQPGYLQIFMYGLILLFILAFAYLQTRNVPSALIFTFGLLTAFLFLSIIAYLLMKSLRKLDLSHFNFIIKQGIANLFRPDNQTMVMTLCIGLGTTLIGMLFIVQHILLNKVAIEDSPRQPNLIVFDIQPAQKNDVIEFTSQNKLPLLQSVPIVTMRLETINGRSKNELEKDSSTKFPSWVFNREYRVTFRDSLVSSEKLVDGKLAVAPIISADTAMVSVEEGYSKTIQAGIGDVLVFNVQGTILPVKIGSIRKVDWKRIQTNFLILFPTGILESAPTFYVLSTRTPSKNFSAQFQTKLIRAFPNVSVIDLTQILQTLKEVLAKITFVIKFMALFSIITGIIVVLGSVRMSKYQRVKESVLLRTLGAGKWQILGINMVEYFILGLIGTTAGIIFSLIASWGFAIFLLESPFVVDWISLIFLVFIVPITVMVIGLFNVGNIIRKPPLEILRSEIS